MRKLLSFMLSGVFAISAGTLSAAEYHSHPPGPLNDSDAASVNADSSEVIFFRFQPKASMFFFSANEEVILEAGELIESNRAAIEDGRLLISVDGYCSSFKTERSNYQMAKLRSSQVKSYFITNSGMKEEYFVTANHTYAYEGHPEIAVKLSLLNREEETQDYAAPDVQTEPDESEEVPPEEEEFYLSREAAEDSSADTRDVSGPVQSSPAIDDKMSEYDRWSFKTNIPAWALVVANAAVEYRFAEHWSVDFPLYYSCWTTARTYRFRTLAIQPSLRYWLSPEWKGHFFGVHLTTGQYNISVDRSTRYQDVNGMYGIGLDYGYGLNLSEHWGLEFNIGAGYIYTKYDSFYNIDNGALYDTSAENYWGLTRCGISIIYRL